VAKETVMADYMRTNEYTLPQSASVIDGFVAAGGDRAIPEAIIGVKPEYLRGFLRRDAEALRDDRGVFRQRAGHRRRRTEGPARSFPAGASEVSRRPEVSLLSSPPPLA
jgi:hypothetical protein